MSHFEYVMVIVSIILGLGLTVILRGLARLARGALPCAVVVVWGFLLLFLFLQNWWAFWDLAQVTQWTQPSFLFVALYCCIMYAMAELMLPIGATPETDWTAHFLSIRKWFFSLLSLLTVLAVLLIVAGNLTGAAQIATLTAALLIGLGGVIVERWL